MVNPNYKCKQADLYTACRLGWLRCIEHIDEFSVYKSKYTLKFANENLALIKTVEAIESHSVRIEAVRNSLKGVDAAQSDAAVFYKQLQGYIKEAYQDNKTTYDAQLTEAGKSNFSKVTKGDWREVNGLFSAMTRFVQNYENELLKKGYMPADFLTRLQASQNSFSAARQTHKSESEAVPDSSEPKIIANNDLKARLMSVLADGQIVFVNDKATAQKFVWTTILSDARGVKPAGVGGFITDAETEAPLSIATAHIVALNKTVTTDEKGRYELSPLPVGTHAIEYKAEGYETLYVKERDIKPNIIGRLNVALVPIAK